MKLSSQPIPLLACPEEIEKSLTPKELISLSISAANRVGRELRLRHGIYPKYGFCDVRDEEGAKKYIHECPVVCLDILIHRLWPAQYVVEGGARYIWSKHPMYEYLEVRIARVEDPSLAFCVCVLKTVVRIYKKDSP